MRLGLKSSPGWWYDMLHHQGFYTLWDHHNLLILYPFLSWSGLMMLGYCFGKLFLQYENDQRKKMLLWLGFGVIAFFIVLRYINKYGDPDHWSTQKNAVFTFLSFMNIHKYPPSLLYTCALLLVLEYYFLLLPGIKKTGLQDL
jgi:uncharacterized membrane protein